MTSETPEQRAIRLRNERQKRYRDRQRSLYPHEFRVHCSESEFAKLNRYWKRMIKERDK